MVINFSQINTDEMPVLILRNLDGTAIQPLGYAFNTKVEFMYNEMSTLTFDLPAYIEGKLTPHYNDVIGMRIIDMDGYGQFILVDPEEESDGVKKLKSCKAYSLEYEFTKKNITMENGTYKFWDLVNPEDTVIGRILERMPDWSLGTIDNDLIDKYRTFEVTEENVYNFIKSTVQKTFGCIFDFDTYTRTINIVSIDTEVEAKPIYLSDERLIKKIQIDEDSDNIVTCLDVNGAEGVDIRNINPTGQNKIYNLDYFMNETNFPKPLIDKWNTWQQLCETNQQAYYTLNIERSLKTTQITTEQVALVTLQNELKGYESVQSVIIQSGSSDAETKKRLREAKNSISDKNDEISAKKARISELEDDRNNIDAKIKYIVSSLSMQTYFTEDEYTTLNKYFIEGTLEDETFVAASTATYTDTDISNKLTGELLKISEYTSDNNKQVSAPTITKITTDGTKTLYSIEGGQIEIAGLRAIIVRASIELNTDKSFVLTAYLNKGSVGDESFEVGNVSAIGDYTSLNTTSKSIGFTVNDCTLYFTHDVTDFERHSIEYDLYDYGKQVLTEKASPTYTFTIDSGNFLYLKDFISFKTALTLGKRLYLRLDQHEDVITPYLIGVEWEFEDPASFKLTFGNTYTAFDKSFKLSKLLEDSVSMGRTLNTKSGMFSEFVNSGASSSVKDFMNSALDIAKNAVLSSGNQAITFDDTGLRLRKWNDNKTAYEDEQIWMTDNVIAFTDDNWATAKMAIGKIFDPNISGTGYAYGIAAPYIVGTLLAGENLVIDARDGESNTFFKVDSSGVYIDAEQFIITHSGRNTSLEDKFNSISGDITAVDDKLSQFIVDGKYLKSDALKGVIDATHSQMKNSNGDVVFDSEGIWLLDNPDKSLATKAIWLNENGIQFGSGKATNDATISPSDDKSGWSWTTSIDYRGVIADEIAAGTLSGMTIVGGSLNIGNGNFQVDTSGNGTFTGTVRGDNFQVPVVENGITVWKDIMNRSNQILSNYLSLYGLKIYKDGTSTTNDSNITLRINDDGSIWGAKGGFQIDKDGSLTITGNIHLSAGSVIDWDNVADNGAMSRADSAYSRADSAYSRAGTAISAAKDAADDVYNMAIGKYKKAASAATTFIDGTNIYSPIVTAGTMYSPNIYANTLTIEPDTETDSVNKSSGGIEMKSYYDDKLYRFLKIAYGGGIVGYAPTIVFSSPGKAYAKWEFIRTTFDKDSYVDFNNCTVENLNVPAVFG